MSLPYRSSVWNPGDLFLMRDGWYGLVLSGPKLHDIHNVVQVRILCQFESKDSVEVLLFTPMFLDRNVKVVWRVPCGTATS